MYFICSSCQNHNSVLTNRTSVHYVAPPIEIVSQTEMTDVESNFNLTGHEYAEIDLDLPSNQNNSIEQTSQAINDGFDYVNYYHNSQNFDDRHDEVASESIKKEKSLNTAHYIEPQPIITATDEQLSVEHDSSFDTYVRKCCKPTQYFNLDAQGCVESEVQVDIRDYLHDIVIGNRNETIILKSRILKCPNPEERPALAQNVSSYTHLLDQGFLYDVEAKIHYSQELYCLELIGDHVSSEDLTAA